MSTPNHDGEAFAASAQDEYYHNARERSINDDEMMEEYSEKPPPPRKTPFYKNKKIMIPCLVISAILIVVIVCLMVFVFFPMICQSLMNQAGVNVNAALISFSAPTSGPHAKRDFNPQTEFMMNMDSTLKNTGPFAATIVFNNPIEIHYNDTKLGTITLPNTNIAGGQGALLADTPFLINDTNFFASFSKDMLALDTFYWTMKGSAVITALGRSATVNLDKNIGIPGMGGFKDVKIQSFNLPSNGPNNTGIVVELGTIMNSPSPVSIALGTIKLNIGYQGVNLGTVTGQGVTLQSGQNPIQLNGVIEPLSNQADLDKVGDMFSKYVTGNVAQTSAVGVSCAPDGANSIQWLSEAFTSLTLNVGLQNQGGPLKIIKGVSMGYLDLAFSAQNPYSPTINAPNIVADWGVPFGFTLGIYEVTQNITMNTTQGGNFSQLVVPWVPSQSDQQSGKLQFAVNQGTLQTLPGKNDAFNAYTYDLTASNNYTFGVTGVANTKTTTPIGNITLSGVSFVVDTSLHGFQFLNSTPTTIGAVDMIGGTKDALQLNIGAIMGNPSDISMSIGDVTFKLLSNDSTQVGTATLANLTLQRGNNNVTVQANFDPRSSQQGQNMLSSFVMGQNSTTSIAGFQGSTAIQSLINALGSINIATTLPGLKAPLIQFAALTVLPNTPQTSIVNVAVTIANPFTAGLAITKVISAATYKGMPVGNINQDISSNPYVIGGHATTASPQLNMQMNLEPSAVALLMRDLAVDAHLDTTALDALLGMGGFHIQGQQSVNPTAAVFQGFNISSYVMQAMTALKADLDLTSTLQVGDYVDDLSFAQNGVQIKSDDTVTRLIPIVGQPIVQAIVNGATLGFDTLVLSNPTDNNAAVQMKGSILKTGPMDATISFPTPLSVRFQGKEIGTASMPPVNAVADQGAQFDVPSNFVITDAQGMENFAAYMINNEEFVWEIVSNDVSVTALGFTFTNISMDKFVTIKGCNGFKNDVIINSFNLPANDPAGGITLTTATSITNPSQVGFNLNSVQFLAYYQQTQLGPLGASPGNFAPAAVSSLNMTGRLIPQSGQGLADVTTVFENYLAAKDTPVTVKGYSASGPTGQVGWLTNAFKTLTIENVIMPGPKEKPQLIPSITMNNMQLDFTKDAWAPGASSTSVVAQLKSPFGFPLGVSQLSMEVDSKVGGQEMAHLSIPVQKASTDANNVVTTSFSNVPFASKNNDIFSMFMAALTKSANGTFELAGTSNALADTAIGAIQLNNVGFDVQTSLAGFNNFDGKTQILSTTVSGGTSEYVIVDTVVAFNNPSQITITIGDLNLDALYAGTKVGSVYFTNTVIKPGMNQFSSVFHLFGDTNAVGQVFSDYLTNAQIGLSIIGSQQSTKVASLQTAMQTVNLATTMQGFQSNLIAGVKVIATLGGVLAQKAQTIVTLQNPLKTEYVLTDLHADVFFTPSSGGSFKVGHVAGIPGPCSVPAGGSTNCDQWTVNLDANLPQLLLLITAPNKNLNLQQNISTTVGGGNGYKSQFYYYQNNVPTSMELDAGLLNLPLGPQVNTTGNPTASMGQAGPSSSGSASGPASSAPASSGGAPAIPTIIPTTTAPPAAPPSTETPKSDPSPSKAEPTPPTAPTASGHAPSGQAASAA
ncbi:hypothetical protein DM01DRAFT_1321012, partial [Hesseltinella vesiculosa]